MNPVEYIYSCAFRGVKLGLHNTRHFLRAMGDPHLRYPVVHIAGTSGKGSVCAFLSSILRQSGLRVGCYTSPNLVSYCERIEVNGNPISMDDLGVHVEKAKPIIEDMAAGEGVDRPTFFEVGTVLAFEHFAYREVDIAVVEVGLGGRFDSTNVVSPVACAITSISLEHRDYLGETLEEIAGEKAGIIKERTPTVIGNLPPEAREVIREKCKVQECPLIFPPSHYTVRNIVSSLDETVFEFESPALGAVPLSTSLPGPWQAENASVAAALALVVKDNPAVSGRMARIDGETLRRGIAAAAWPGRLETISHAPRVVLDCTHTLEGACLLAEFWKRATNFPQTVVIFSCLKDKPVEEMCRKLAPVASSFILAPIQHDRGTPIEVLTRAVAPLDVPFVTCASLEETLAPALAQAGQEGAILMTGSVYGIGEVYEAWRGELLPAQTAQP